MFIQIDPKGKSPVWQQIVNKMKDLVVKSILIPGEKIPSIDEMAKILAVNRKLVSKAYEELETLGIIESVRDVGVFISVTSNKETQEKRLIEIKLELNRLITEGKALGINEGELNILIKEIYN